MSENQPLDCNCAVVRQAARHVTQLYDRWLAPYGLKTSQFSVLATLRRRGPLTINALADALVTDRTTMGRNLRPLERDGLVAMEVGRDDRRSRELRVTEKGEALVKRAHEGWGAAQDEFEKSVGAARAAEFRALLRDITAVPFSAEAAPPD